MSAPDQDRPNQEGPKQEEPGRPAGDGNPLRAQNRLLVAQAEALRAELAASREEVRRLSALLVEARADAVGRARPGLTLKRALGGLFARFGRGGGR